MLHLPAGLLQLKIFLTCKFLLCIYAYQFKGTSLKKIPHRHFAFSIPKIIRRYFLYDRKLLAALSRCAWEFLRFFSRMLFLKMIPYREAYLYLPEIHTPAESEKVADLR